LRSFRISKAGLFRQGVISVKPIDTDIIKPIDTDITWHVKMSINLPVAFFLPAAPNIHRPIEIMRLSP